MNINLRFDQFANQPEIEAAAFADNGDLPPYPGSPRLNQLPFIGADVAEDFLNVNAPNHGQNEPHEQDLDLAVPNQAQNQAQNQTHEGQDNPIQRHPTGIFGGEHWEVYTGLDYIDEVVNVYAQEEELENDEDYEKVLDRQPSDNSIQPHPTGIDPVEYGEVDTGSNYSDELVNANPQEEKSEKDEKVLDSQPSELPLQGVVDDEEMVDSQPSELPLQGVVDDEEMVDSQPSEPPSQRVVAADIPSVKQSPSISVDNKLLHDIAPPNQSIAMMGVPDVPIRDADAPLPFGSVLERPHSP